MVDLIGSAVTFSFKDVKFVKISSAAGICFIQIILIFQVIIILLLYLLAIVTEGARSMDFRR